MPCTGPLPLIHHEDLVDLVAQLLRAEGGPVDKMPDKEGGPVDKKPDKEGGGWLLWRQNRWRVADVAVGMHLFT